MMHVPDEHLNCVIFLCVEQQDDDGVMQLVPKATGFFVRVHLTQVSWVEYIVTARHCIEEARISKTLYIRANRRGGGFVEIPTDVDDWTTSDDADVAAIPLPIELPSKVKWDDLIKVSINLDQFVGPGPEYKWHGTPFDAPVTIQPRVGHEMFFVGLFTQTAGEQRNLPIARFGRIARMPSMIRMGSKKRPFSAVAYLAELNSLGGHSGSPVFFQYPFVVQDKNRSEDETYLLDTDVRWAMVSGFLGLVSGHYEIPKEAETTGDVLLGKIETELNAGIAMITPAEAIKVLLLREDLCVKQRELRLEKLEKNKPIPTMDFSDEPGFTGADFERALEKVNRRLKTSESDEASSET